ncbi:hypothetical protein [Aridibaculum aurantiacum]|uniref:hypothetical protein n=1 Tax=Aridibaculum aurantiacum TaxID=2810307 RepID=UPI001A970D8C|nr:hypothetical protein [Aridibaculum aurantiacum]
MKDHYLKKKFKKPFSQEFTRDSFETRTYFYEGNILNELNNKNQLYRSIYSPKDTILQDLFIPVNFDLNVSPPSSNPPTSPPQLSLQYPDLHVKPNLPIRFIKVNQDDNKTSLKERRKKSGRVAVAKNNSSNQLGMIRKQLIMYYDDLVTTERNNLIEFSLKNYASNKYLIKELKVEPFEIVATNSERHHAIVSGRKIQLRLEMDSLMVLKKVSDAVLSVVLPSKPLFADSVEPTPIVRVERINEEVSFHLSTLPSKIAELGNSGKIRILLKCDSASTCQWKMMPQEEGEGVLHISGTLKVFFSVDIEKLLPLSRNKFFRLYWEEYLLLHAKRNNNSADTLMKYDSFEKLPKALKAEFMLVYDNKFNQFLEHQKKRYEDEVKQPYEQNIEVVSVKFRVEDTMSNKLFGFFKNNWQWLWTFLLVPLVPWFIGKIRKPKVKRVGFRPSK